MKNHFLYFTKAERFGIIALLAICLALWIVPACIPDRHKGEQAETTPLPDLHQAVDSTHSSLFEDLASRDQATLQPFNPNLVSKAELLAMGLSERTARSWQNYLQKGGRFKNWQDLERFRALGNADRERLKAYVRFNRPVAKMAREEKTTAPITLAAFDPNEQSEQSLMAMGLSKRVARNWNNYLNAGGRFRRAEDVHKVYGLAEEDYQRLLPYIDIPDPQAEWASAEAIPEVALPSSYDKTEHPLTVDINRATAEEWQRLRGIGPAYSRRIVKFRDKLGGFHSVEQVKETYGLPDSVYQSILLQLRPSPIFQKLAVNLASVEELAAHPYLRWDDARMIIRYRQEHGAYHSPADLQQLYGLPAETLVKMEPYWDFKE